MPHRKQVKPEAAKSEKSRDAIDGLVDLLNVETLDQNLYRGASSATSWGRVYGGQVLAQALVSATRTVSIDRPLHSLHGYFLSAGHPEKPIVYQVENLRDGGSFSTRRVTALQDAHPIFAMMASFHVTEPGFEHQEPMPDVPPPEDVRPLGEVLADPAFQVPDAMRAFFARRRPFDLRLVEVDRYRHSQIGPARQNMWMRAPKRLPDDERLHTALLTYASDFSMIDTALIPHGKIMFDPGMQLASLDHALWIHAPARVDDWFLYALESPAAGGARGLARGSFYSRDGRLLASIAQEGLMRVRSTAFVIK